MNLSLFLARRFFSSTGKDRASRPATLISVVGITVGLAVMIVSLCVVRGFQKEVAGRVMGFGAHVEVLDMRTFASPENFPITADSGIIDGIKSLPDVAHVGRYAAKIGILKTDDAFSAVELKGLAPEYDTSFIEKSLVRGKMPQLSDTASSGKLVISKYIADELEVDTGQSIMAYFFEETVKMRRFKIAAIYQTNLKQFDKTFAITDIHTVQRLNTWDAKQVSGVEVKLHDFDQLEDGAQQIANFVNTVPDTTSSARNVLTIKENPRTAGVFNWLALLDTNVYVILILVLLVSAFAMISGLLILILERTQTIGVLKALGAANSLPRRTFLYYGALIILRGMLYGNILSLALLWAQQHFGIVHLNPETYYVDVVPVSIEPLPILILNVVCLLLTFASLIIPAHLTSRVQPAKTIRFD